MDCSLLGSSVHGIFQAIVLEWIAISFSRGSSQPRDQTRVSHIVDRCLTVWVTREVHPKHPVLTAFWAPYCINSFFLACIVCIVKAMVFPVAMYRCESWTKKRLSAEEPMLSNCDAGEDSWESWSQKEDQTSQSYRKSTLNIHWKEWNSDTC